MAHYTRKIFAAAGVATTLLASTASAADGVSIGIRARAATICRVEFAGTAPGQFRAGETPLGRMTELCNNVEGYTLVLNHPQGLIDAWVTVDGQRVTLASNSTRTVIVDSHIPAYRERQLSLGLSQDMQGSVPFSLYAEAKGVIF